MVNRESLDRQNQQMKLKPVPTFGRSKVTSSTIFTKIITVTKYLINSKTIDPHQITVSTGLY